MKARQMFQTLLAFAVLTTFTSRPSHAYWAITYKGQGAFTCANHLFDHVNRPGVSPWRTEGILAYTSNGFAYPAYSVGMPYGNTDKPSNTSAGRGSVTATLTWTPHDWTRDSPPPSKIYLMETSMAVFQSGGGNCSDEDTCADENTYSVGQLDNGFGDAQLTRQELNWTWTAQSAGSHLLIIDNPTRSSQITLPTRTMSMSVSLSRPVSKKHNLGMNASVWYVVKAINFAIRSHGDSLTYGDPVVNVAPGAKETEVHSLDMFIEATAEVLRREPLAPGYITRQGNEVYSSRTLGIPGIHLQPTVSTGGGGSAPSGNAVLNASGSETDAEGKIFLDYRSGNVIQDATITFGNGEPSQLAKLDHRWGGTLAPISISEYEQSTPVTFTPKTFGYNPKFTESTQNLDAHTVKFVVSKVTLREWDQQLDNFKDVDSYDPELLCSVATFAPSTVTDNDGDGEYNTSVTFHKVEAMVRKVTISAVDESVYKKY